MPLSVDVDEVLSYNNSRLVDRAVGAAESFSDGSASPPLGALDGDSSW